MLTQSGRSTELRFYLWRNLPTAEVSDAATNAMSYACALIGEHTFDAPRLDWNAAGAYWRVLIHGDVLNEAKSAGFSTK